MSFGLVLFQLVCFGLRPDTEIKVSNPVLESGLKVLDGLKAGLQDTLADRFQVVLTLLELSGSSVNLPNLSVAHRNLKTHLHNRLVVCAR